MSGGIQLKGRTANRADWRRVLRRHFYLSHFDARESTGDGDITQAEHDLAWREANRLLTALERGELALLELCPAHRQALLSITPFD